MHAWIHLLHSVMDEIGTLLLTSMGAVYYSETCKKKLPKFRDYHILSFCSYVGFIRGFLVNIKQWNIFKAVVFLLHSFSY